MIVLSWPPFSSLSVAVVPVFLLCCDVCGRVFAHSWVLHSQYCTCMAPADGVSSLDFSLTGCSVERLKGWVFRLLFMQRHGRHCHPGPRALRCHRFAAGAAGSSRLRPRVGGVSAVAPLARRGCLRGSGEFLRLRSSETDFEGQWCLRLFTDCRARMFRRVRCVFRGSRSEARLTLFHPCVVDPSFVLPPLCFPCLWVPEPFHGTGSVALLVLCL